MSKENDRTRALEAGFGPHVKQQDDSFTSRADAESNSSGRERRGKNYEEKIGKIERKDVKDGFKRTRLYG